MKDFKTSRRKFIRNSSMAAALPFISCGSKAVMPGLNPDYERLDEILKQPILRKGYFPDPVIIDTLELLRYGSRRNLSGAQRSAQITISDLYQLASAIFYK